MVSNSCNEVGSGSTTHHSCLIHQSFPIYLWRISEQSLTEMLIRGLLSLVEDMYISRFILVCGDLDNKFNGSCFGIGCDQTSIPSHGTP